MTETIKEKPGRGSAGFRSEDERIIEIEIERLRDFKDHPFKIKADDQMHDLMESIERYGILTPLIVSDSF